MHRRILQTSPTKQYQWTDYRHLAAIIPVLVQNAPTLYVVDTEFCRLESGRVKVTEATIIDVKAGRIAASAVLDGGLRKKTSSQRRRKTADSRSRKKTTGSRKQV